MNGPAPSPFDIVEAVSFSSSPRFKLSRFDEIKPDAGAQYLVKGLLPSTGLAVIWGAPKCGKSFWTFDILMHIVLDWEYRGRRVKPGAVVYCALEGAQGFKRRVEAFRQAKLAESADAAPPFFLMATPLSLVADQAQLVADIRAQVGDAKPVAVCIDTLNRSIAGSENDDEAMGAYVRAADAIRAAFDCLVVIVHHSGYSAERPRGHSSLVGALDVQISVKRDSADNIVTELELAKDEATGLQFVSRLNVVEIGCDDDGDPITSCVVEPADETCNPTEKKAAAKLKRHLRRAPATPFVPSTRPLAKSARPRPPQIISLLALASSLSTSGKSSHFRWGSAARAPARARPTKTGLAARLLRAPSKLSRQRVKSPFGGCTFGRLVTELSGTLGTPLKGGVPFRSEKFRLEHRGTTRNKFRKVPKKSAAASGVKGERGPPKDAAKPDIFPQSFVRRPDSLCEQRTTAGERCGRSP